MRIILLAIFFLYNFIILSSTISSSIKGAQQELQKGNISLAVEIIKKASANNDVVAQFYLAQCLEHGFGVEKNTEAAFFAYRRAAERGFPQAMERLANCYKYGIGVSVDFSKAQEWNNRYLKRRDDFLIPDIFSFVSDQPHNDDATHNPDNSSKPSPNTPGENNLYRASTNSQSIGETSRSFSSIQLKYESPSSNSPVDNDIPINTLKNDNTFAIIIANENYQDVAGVPFSHNDGETFAQYCIKTFCIPNTNIHLIKDATFGNMKREINWLKKISDAFSGEINLIVYYSGHGIPDESTRDSYIMPIDASPSDTSTCIKLSDFYRVLSEIQSLKTILFLDACFSGSGRDSNMLVSQRGVTLKPKSLMPSANMIVMSAASGDETAYPYDDKKHGLFTYFLLEKLKESKGNVSLQELFDYIKANVSKKSILINGKSQTPSVSVSPMTISDWGKWTFIN